MPMFLDASIDSGETCPLVGVNRMKIDIEHLKTMTGGDVDLADEVLDIFRNQSATWGRMLDADLPQEQWADAAHTLKGSALSIGAIEFGEACSVVEQLGRGNAVSRVVAATHLSDLKALLSEVIEACATASYELSKPGLR